MEVMRITNPEKESEIHNLELHAGCYYDEVVIQGTVAGIYLFHEIGKHPLVVGGDWVKFFGQKG